MAPRNVDDDWATLMRSASRGDAKAYRRFLLSLSARLRIVARQHGARFRFDGAQIEDVVQETLLAIHLKRHTWDETRPITPWIAAILRNKMIDAYRRRQAQPVGTEALMLTLPAPAQYEEHYGELDKSIDKLDERGRDLVRSISLEGESIAEVARRLKMKEGAVRVALHRAIKSLAKLCRAEDE